MDPPSKTSDQKYTSSELLSSAKLLSEAAQASLRNESDKVDKAKVADAAGDLLDAAGQYAKLDEQKGIGQYVEKGADYLHHYKGDSAPSNPSTTAPPSESHPPKQEESKSEGGGGFGQFTKLAGDFLGKKWFHHIIFIAALIYYVMMNLNNK